jgi:hypothetical protein
MIVARHVDNPVYFNADGTPTQKGRDYVLGKLARLTGVRRARLYEGRWASAEGVIYDGWDPAHHLVDRFEIPKEWPRYWAVDFGLVHPFVCQWWAEDPDGRLFRYREIHMRGRLVEEHARDMLLASTRAVKREGESRSGRFTTGAEVLESIAKGDRAWDEPRPRAVITDHAAQERGTLSKHIGITPTPATKDVVPGINAVAARLVKQRDGRARLFLLRDSLYEIDTVAEGDVQPLCTEAEIPAYSWARKADGTFKKDEPVKIDDDGCDTMRYMVSFRDLRKGSRAGWLPA